MKLKAFLSDTFAVRKGAMKINTKGIIEEYREKYDHMINDLKRKPKAYTYKVTPGNRVMVHIKVPSETVEGFYYDVLLELSADNSAVDFGDCDIKIFSNCPSFVYSVAYVFAHWDPDANKPTEKGKGMMIDTLRGKLPRNRMMIPGAEKKLGRRPVHEAPETRNPMGLPLFDKSIYYAVFFMMDTMDFMKVMGNHNYCTIQHVFESVAFFDTLMIQRKHAENKQRENKIKQQADIQSDMKKLERGVDKLNRPNMMNPKNMASSKVSTHTLKRPNGMKSARTTKR